MSEPNQYLEYFPECGHEMIRVLKDFVASKTETNYSECYVLGLSDCIECLEEWVQYHQSQMKNSQRD